MLTPVHATGRNRLIRLALAAATSIAMLTGGAIPALANISNECTGHGYSTPGGNGKPADVAAAKTGSASGGTTVDFKSQSLWEVPSYKDYLAGEGISPAGSMGSGFADVVFYGLHFHVVGGEGHGSSGMGGPISASELELPGPLKGKPVASYLVAYGAGTPDANPPAGTQAAPHECSGFIVIHFGDVSPADSVVGEVGILLIIIGGVGLIVVSIRRTA